MKKKLIHKFLNQAKKEKRRLVIPLVGFPGLNLTGCTVKLAQQNFGEHYKVLKAIAETFNPDAIFPLMDLSVEANALGRYTIFPKGESATVIREEFKPEDLAAAEQVNILYDTRLLGYVETIKLLNHGLQPSILRGAYVTGPYTLAALLLGADEAARDTIEKCDELMKLCRFTTSKILDYVRLLISNGAQIICILEPSAVMLGPIQFEQFSGCFVKSIVNDCRNSETSLVYHICGNSMHLIEKMAESGVDALSLDSPDSGVDLNAAADKISSDLIIMGNINPTGTILYGHPDEVEIEVSCLLNKMEHYPNFILSTGCDLPQDIPIENIIAFMHAGQKYRIN